MHIWTIVRESFMQVMQTIAGNRLRTFLSIIGITIGIFCIISVKSAVDSLHDNIISGFKELGSDVIYIDKMPWNNTSYEKMLEYQKRPEVLKEETDEILRRSKLSKAVSFAGIKGGNTAKYHSNSIENVYTFGTTYDYGDMFKMKISQGRHFTPSESNSGSNVVILGYKIAEALFPNIDPIGRELKYSGTPYTVIGVLEAEGDNMFNVINYDQIFWVTYNNLKKTVNTGIGSRIGRMLAVQAKKGVSSEELKEELTGIMRSIRRIRPKAKENFALNELSMLNQMLDSIFGVLNIAGFLIGIFALVVGMFSVANIMFVSVKERTNIIGIKKALGARRKFILTEFLIESVILCVIGGILGLLLVFGVLYLVSTFSPFQMSLNITNILFGVGTSIIVGILAGIIPAFQASKLDPVVAIRG